MTENDPIAGSSIGSRLKELAAYAIRTEFAGKSTEELIRVVKQERLIALRRTLAEEELIRRGIDIEQASNEESGQIEDVAASQPPEDSLPSSADIPSQQAPADVSRAPFSNYVEKHWRGEFDLLESFWGNVVLINVVINVLTTLLLKADFFAEFGEEFPRTAWLLALIFVLALHALWVWQVVGLWRSASNHVKMTSRQFWARISQIIVLLSTVGVANQAVCHGSSFLETAKLAFGLSPLDEFQVIAVDGGDTIEVSGGIGAGLADQVANELAANPDVRVIKLNSLGGRMSEARRLRDLISQRQLITYTSDQCHSACAMAFIGGGQRVLHKDAELGFHQPSLAGQSSGCDSTEDALLKQKTQDMIRAEIRVLIDAGVDPSFAKKAMSIPPNQIWRPTPEQLLRAGMISRVVDDV